MNISLVKAELKDADFAYSIICDARNFQREQGFVQWSDDYPNLSTVENDINDMTGYMIMDDDRQIGYICIDPDGEPTYRIISGQWKTNRRYVVLHRMAVCREMRGKGVTKDLFKIIRSRCKATNVPAVRVDTYVENKRMQHILEREGFEYCGVITYDGSPRLAYEYDID